MRDPKKVDTITCHKCGKVSIAKVDIDNKSCINCGLHDQTMPHPDNNREVTMISKKDRVTLVEWVKMMSDWFTGLQKELNDLKDKIFYLANTELDGVKERVNNINEKYEELDSELDDTKTMIATIEIKADDIEYIQKQHELLVEKNKDDIDLINNSLVK